MPRRSRDRQKLTIYLSPEERKQLEDLRGLLALKTNASALRSAVRIALKRLKEPGAEAELLCDLFRWAETLQFTSQRERIELAALRTRRTAPS